jgi:parvulin-like peptidyl-prolyl isomerase
MKRLLKEPLLHFLLLGAALFGAYRWVNRSAPDQPEKKMRAVVITTNQVAALSEAWTRQMQRPPTQEELRGLVTGYLKEELLARQAREMGLADNDSVIRHRLAQQLEFLVRDTSPLPKPAEADLRRVYESNPERFQTPARVSFTHVYFVRDSRKDAAADARGALAQLSRPPYNARPADVGDLLMRDAEVLNADEQTVSSQFGKDFAREVFAFQPGEWHGPIESAYGFHLVRVSAAEPAKLRQFAEVKPQVLELWRSQQRRGVSEKYYAGLLKKYGLVVDENLKPLIGPLSGPIAAPTNGAEPLGPK